MPYLAQFREESITIPRRIMINSTLDGQRCVNVRFRHSAQQIFFIANIDRPRFKLQFIRRRAFKPRPKLSQHKHHVLCRDAP